MELRQICGDTWVLEAGELIPLVRLPGGRCVLLDTGLSSEREVLAAALEHHRLTPMGVFASHSHQDHMGNAFYLQSTYGARLSLPEGEAALCKNTALYRGGYDTYTPKQVEERYAHIIGHVDETVGPMDGGVIFCGVPLEVVHTPGHSPDHICTLTPDGVLYTGDALLAGQFLEGAKLPYHYIHAQARRSMAVLRGVDCRFTVAAHRAVCEAPGPVIDENLRLLDQHCGELLAVLERPMTLDELVFSLAQRQKMLTSHLDKACLYARNARTFLEYLVDEGRVEITVCAGMRYYQRIGGGGGA